MPLKDEDLEEIEDMNLFHKRAMGYLRLFGPETYGINIPREIASILMKKGWIEWMPPKFGTTLYALTDEGRRVLELDQHG